MKKVMFLLSVSLFFLVSTSRAATLMVDDDKVQCPMAQYTTIQAAVNAAQPGDVIRVCPGTYPEQVTITMALTLRADNGVVVNPATTQTVIDVAGTEAIAFVFVVQGANVDIDGFIVDGTNNALDGVFAAVGWHPVRKRIGPYSPQCGAAYERLAAVRR